MTFEEAEQYLISLRSGGIRPGLERMERAMTLAGNPHRQLRVVHVAGTNGKGSVSRMIQAMASAAGYRVGLYTSPAVTGLCDTITIDGEAIAPERFAALADVWRARQREMGDCGPLSEFEFVTALVLAYFADERVDLCVLECGMGGREDATNICPPPLAAVLMPIARDHTAFLGDTVEAIAAQKCGIMKPPCRVVTSPMQSPEALAVIYEQAAMRGLTVRQPNRTAATRLLQRMGEITFTFANKVYTVPMGGAFQVDNALTALETAAVLRECGFSIDETAQQRGLAAAALPGREEVVSRTPLTVLDGAHNPHGVAALAEALRETLDGAPLTLLYGMLRDKDTAACAALLAPLAKTVVCCTPPVPRGLDAAVLAAEFEAAGAAKVYVCADPADALAQARALSGDGALLIGGSFYTVAAIRPLLGGNAKN